MTYSFRILKTVACFAMLALMSGCGGGSTGDTGVVVTPGSNAVTLTWEVPESNTDGSALDDLSGYKVYYGTASGVYTNSVDVGHVTSTIIDGLESGATYSFSITAYDSSGNESDFCTEVNTTI